MTIPPINFRPVYVDSNLKKTNVYRSNIFDDQQYDNVLWLSKTAGIKTIIDFRDKKEISKQSKLYDTYVNQNLKLKGIRMKSKDQSSESDGKLYHFTFVNAVFILKIIFNYMTFFEICKLLWLLFLHLFYFDYAFFLFMTKTLHYRLSLGKTYCLFVDHFPTRFKEIFTILAEKENFPVLLLCKYGRDRTGLLATMIMLLMGCEDEFAVAEYMKSKECLKPIKQDIIKSSAILGFGKDFIKMKPENARIFIDHLKYRYGGVESYLKRCGITNEQIHQIKRNIVAPL